MRSGYCLAALGCRVRVGHVKRIGPAAGLVRMTPLPGVPASIGDSRPASTIGFSCPIGNRRLRGRGTPDRASGGNPTSPGQDQGRPAFAAADELADEYAPTHGPSRQATDLPKVGDHACLIHDSQPSRFRPVPPAPK